jgi:hypothetical protein
MKDRRNVNYEYRKMSTKELTEDPLYQRDIDPKRIARIVKKYDPCLVNAIKVSFRDGKYWIFDGQHTKVAEKTVRGKGKDVIVDCKVFSGLTRLDEMELFVEQNGESANVSINSKLKALYNFGDPDVTGMVSAATLAGCIINFSKGTGTNKVTAISTAMKLYLKMPRDHFIDMLTTIRTAWQGSADGFVREILQGMGLFYEKYYGRFTPRDLSKSLYRVSPVQLDREGKSIGTATVNYARLILRAYNANRTTHRLPDEL